MRLLFMQLLLRATLVFTMVDLLSCTAPISASCRSWPLVIEFKGFSSKYKLVHNSLTVKLLCRYGNRGVQAVAFSAGGSKLASIATDNSHTLFIWEWKTAQLLTERKSQAGTPPCVYGVLWSQFEHNRWVHTIAMHSYDRILRRHCCLTRNV